MANLRPLVLLLLLLLAVLSQAQAQAQAPPPADVGCNGVLLTYNLDGREKIRPFVSDPNNQPYRFTATATVLNSGTSPILSWSLLIGFAHGEVIVSAGNAVITDGSDYPYNTSAISGPTSFSGGSGNPNLKTAIATAGDLNQIEAQIPIVGTLFAQAPPFVPLPSSLSLDDPSFICPTPAGVFNTTTNTTTTLSTCCVPNPKFRANSTDDPLAGAGNATLFPRRSGDLTINFDVIQAYPSSYLADVTITNHNPLGRLDNWHLSWEWMRGEFMIAIKGAYTTVEDPGECILGAQGQYFQGLDFSKVINCQRRPTILDLPLAMANDTDRGLIPFCCRNGTILPAEMDPSQSTSAFQVQVFKMPPDLNRTLLFPPQNWRISGGTLNPDFRCSPPARVAPAQFPDPSGLQLDTLAIASWQVVCNITQPKGSSPKCCVSFSAYYNDTVVPCKTCACGCPKSLGRTCNATAPALLLPPQALLLPFDNRTQLAREWARIKHLSIPRPMPCGDFCGVSINWHINSDYSQGWTARVTLFNWEEVTFADWFAAIEMGKAYDGFEAMYSFNATQMGNSTIFMQGVPGLNYLVGEVDGTNPATDPRVPGKQQSVISFTKKTTPGIDVATGDGFPTKVFFNGEECSLPDIIPTSWGFKIGVGGIFSLVLLLVTTVFVLLEP